MDFTKLGTAAAESEDQSVEKKGTRQLPREGAALMRLRSYIELGRHAPKNPQHKPAFKTLLEFELLHPDHMIDTDDGKIPMTLTVRVNKTASSKGKFLPLFQKMNYDGKSQHMMQMIGKAFLGQLTHNKSEDGQNVYVNLTGADGAWNIGEPAQVDALTMTKTDIPVPELRGEARGFLWENENISDEDLLAMWESIFIEGTRTDDEGKEHSKNWIQETIQKNLEWEGSKIQMLTETTVDVSELSGGDAPVSAEAALAAGATTDAASGVPTY